ncbi:YopX family protein [Leuconostoc citreum]|uniref:YopX family protein n=1 Tax=Leuconostoc citreum TaxID=33964 RepID=UPI0021A54146|nr:YopX family protein [Leuconostoc citreum]
MRDIKFRAWNSSISVLANVIEIRFNQNSILTDDSKFLWDLNKAVLEQYTGLKDKNGVEIYENDIIHVQSNLYKDHIGAIIWSQGTAGFCISDNTNEFNIPRPLGIQMDGFLSYEVIGNIHENPDLLEEQ